MLRLILFILVIYLLIRMVNNAFNMLKGDSAGDRRNVHKGKGAKREGMNIDYAPRKEKSASEKYKGGDYVDYEDVDES